MHYTHVSHWAPVAFHARVEVGIDDINTHPLEFTALHFVVLLTSRVHHVVCNMVNCSVVASCNVAVLSLPRLEREPFDDVESAGQNPRFRELRLEHLDLLEILVNK